jgi:hypothetical protein
MDEVRRISWQCALTDGTGGVRHTRLVATELRVLFWGLVVARPKIDCKEGEIHHLISDGNNYPRCGKGAALSNGKKFGRQEENKIAKLSSAQYPIGSDAAQRSLSSDAAHGAAG